MARPTRQEIETFMSITGASHSLALRKLEECGGNLTEAVNAHYRELETHIANPTSGVSPQYTSVDMNNQIQGGSRGLLSAARSFKPSLLFDPNYRRDLANQISASLFTSRPPFNSHTGEFSGGTMQPHQSGPRPVFGDVIRTSSSHGPAFHDNVLRDDEVLQYDNNIEEEMVQAAIEASKRDFEEGCLNKQYSSPNDSSGFGLPQRQLHLEDDEFARAISLSLKMAEQEKAKEDQVRQLGVYDSSGRAGNTNNSRIKLKPGSSSLQKGAEYVEEQPPVPHESNQEWGGISSKELNEAVMLEAAFFSEIPEGSSYHFPRASHLQSGPDRSVGSNPRPVLRPPSASLTERRLLREQQDVEYLASLLSDKEKEINSLKEEESHKKMLQGEEFERWLAAKEASLPQEPAIDDGNAVNLLVRMPDGSRHGRRFLKSDKLQFLFDFIDVRRVVKPGSYRVVRPYPRRAFNVCESSSSLNELGLTSKQEALFLELI